MLGSPLGMAGSSGISVCGAGTSQGSRGAGEPGSRGAGMFLSHCSSESLRSKPGSARFTCLLRAEQ